jgi:3-oxoadipate enol-lactonase
MAKIKVGDINISFEVEGEGPPLVIVNGGGASVAQMKEIGATGQKILEAGYKLIRFDNRGIPPSDAPSPPYTINQMADDTIGLLEYVEIKGASHVAMNPEHDEKIISAVLDFLSRRTSIK